MAKLVSADDALKASEVLNANGHIVYPDGQFKDLWFIRYGRISSYLDNFELVAHAVGLGLMISPLSQSSNDAQPARSFADEPKEQPLPPLSTGEESKDA